MPSQLLDVDPLMSFESTDSPLTHGIGHEEDGIEANRLSRAPIMHGRTCTRRALRSYIHLSKNPKHEDITMTKKNFIALADAIREVNARIDENEITYCIEKFWSE